MLEQSENMPRWPDFNLMKIFNEILKLPWRWMYTFGFGIGIPSTYWFLQLFMRCILVTTRRITEGRDAMFAIDRILYNYQWRGAVSTFFFSRFVVYNWTRNEIKIKILLKICKFFETNWLKDRIGINFFHSN